MLRLECSALQVVLLLPGGESDQTLVVSFFNGKSAEVPLNTAVWLPQSMHDRITFELQLPAKARPDVTQYESLPASPTVADPPDFVQYEPMYVRRVPVGPYIYAGGYEDFPYFLPYDGFSMRYSHSRPMGKMLIEDNTDVVPGCDMTKNELSQKVQQQLQQHDQWLQRRSRKPTHVTQVTTFAASTF